MKKSLSLLFFLILTIQIAAQNPEKEYRTLLDDVDLHISAMGGPMMQFTSVGGVFGHFMGGGGGVLLNDFLVGGYGMGLTNKVLADASAIDPDDYLSIGHGGFWLGYSLFGHLPLHIMISTLVGFGDVALMAPGAYTSLLHDQIFVLTPMLELEANITSFMRMGAGLSHSFFSGVNLDGYANHNFSAPAVVLSFKFGWFR